MYNIVKGNKNIERERVLYTVTLPIFYDVKCNMCNHRVDMCGPGSVLLADQEFVHLVMREAVSCSV
jgi:hypothetical protein